jgi:carboxylesterase
VTGGDASRDDRDALSTEAFHWPAGRLGCLLVHGLSGTPYEMRYLGERLCAAGFSVCGVRLAGHAASVAELERCGVREWYETVEEGFERLRGSVDHVIAIGLSLGALLVLRLAHRRPSDVSGVVVLSTALELASRWPARLAPVLRPLLPWLPEPLRSVPKIASDIADPAARRVHPGSPRLPFGCVIELIGLQREVSALLPEVRQPVLAIHGERDHTTPIGNLEALRALPHLVRSVTLPESCHVVSVDYERERVAEEVLAFVGEIEKRQ